VNATDLEREFAVRAVPYSGGLLLLRPDDALALVRRLGIGRRADFSSRTSTIMSVWRSAASRSTRTATTRAWADYVAV